LVPFAPRPAATKVYPSFRAALGETLGLSDGDRPVPEGKTTGTGALWVLAASGTLGFVVGAISLPDWQVAVETAQVVAGIVAYPPDNPFYIYHAKLWTILHQLSALLLIAGVPEGTLAVVISGLLGLVSFQALSMVVYALTRDALLSIGSAVLMAFARAAETDTVYPIALMGTVHTYGALGLSTFVLVVGLLGSGLYLAGGFLLGLSPALHPALGAWLFIVVAIAFTWRGRQAGEGPASAGRRVLKGFAAGGAVTAISFILQLAMMWGLPESDPVVTRKYLMAFVELWDGHRQPVGLGSQGIQLNAAALALSLIWLKWHARDLPRSSVLLLKLLATAAAVSLIVAFLSHVPARHLPTAFVISMPGRLLNVNAMAFPALLLGLVGVYRSQWWSGLLTVFLSVALAVNNRSRLWDRLAEDSWLRDILPVTRPVQVFTYAVAGLLLGAGLSAWYRRREHVTGQSDAGTSTRILAGLGKAVLVAVPVTLVALTWRGWQAEHGILSGANSAVLERAAQGHGMLLTAGSLDLIQLKTRRPVLLNGGGLDGLPYAPESGPAVERILRDVYEIDFFNPPEAARGKGAVPSAFNRAAWETFSVERWQQIRQTFGVTEVLTPGDWQLPLTLIAGDASYRLYQLP
jgi:hypothetical protein